MLVMPNVPHKAMRLYPFVGRHLTLWAEETLWAKPKLLTIIFVMLRKELDYWYLEERLYNRKLRALDAAA